MTLTTADSLPEWASVAYAGTRRYPQVPSHRLRLATEGALIAQEVLVPALREDTYPCEYEICVAGRLDESWTVWFEDMTLSVGKLPEGETRTTLHGPVRDRAALHGLLSRIRDLGLHLLVVRRVEPTDSVGNRSPDN